MTGEPYRSCSHRAAGRTSRYLCSLKPRTLLKTSNSTQEQHLLPMKGSRSACATSDSSSTMLQTTSNLRGSSLPSLWVISGHLPRKKRCPFFPRKQTCAVQQLMSALGQKRTSESQKKDRLAAVSPKSDQVVVCITWRTLPLFSSSASRVARARRGRWRKAGAQREPASSRRRLVARRCCW